MNVAVLERQTKAETDNSVVDCDIHPTLKSAADFHPYLDQRWIDHMKMFGGARQGFAKTGLYARYNRDGGARMDTKPLTGGPSGSDLDFMRVQHLEPNNICYGILLATKPQGVAQRNHEYGAAISAAINDWQLNAWCKPEPRLKGSIVVNREDQKSAVKEIERWAGSPHFVQITTLPHGLEPFGRERYWPLFEAAEAVDMPIGLHVGGVTGFAPTSSGWPSFYIEEHHSKCEAMQSLVASMVIEGVFERFPKLRIVLIEGGFVWAPSLAWRLDKNYKRLKAEVPHLKRLPSEYMREHFWYTTQPVEEPENRRHLVDVMEWVGWDRILFSTDYPHWDYDDPRYAFKIPFTKEQKEMVFRENAKTLYQLS